MAIEFSIRIHLQYVMILGSEVICTMEYDTGPDQVMFWDI